MASDKIITITSENFEQMVSSSAVPVFLDFWAVWCGPCKAVEPIIDELSQEYEGRFVIGKVNVDEEAEIASNYNIMSIPTFVIVKDGQEAERIIGARAKNDLKQTMDKYL